jgi:hypothetical protein
VRAEQFSAGIDGAAIKDLSMQPPEMPCGAQCSEIDFAVSRHLGGRFDVVANRAARR